MAVELTNEERETCLNMVATDRNTWEVFSDDPVMQARLERIGAELVRSEGPSKFYRLDARQVLLRKIPGKRVLPEAERQKRAERLLQANAARRAVQAATV